jgi:hypothetical protein
MRPPNQDSFRPMGQVEDFKFGKCPIPSLANNGNGRDERLLGEQCSNSSAKAIAIGYHPLLS